VKDTENLHSAQEERRWARNKWNKGVVWAVLTTPGPEARHFIQTIILISTRRDDMAKRMQTMMRALLGGALMVGALSLPTTGMADDKAKMVIQVSDNDS